MNVLLEKLFSQYDISEKDRYEIEQIYGILSSEKKQLLLNNFENLAIKIKKIEEDAIVEQGILLDTILPDIQKLIKKDT